MLSHLCTQLNTSACSSESESRIWSKVFASVNFKSKFDKYDIEEQSPHKQVWRHCLRGDQGRKVMHKDWVQRRTSDHLMQWSDCSIVLSGCQSTQFKMKQLQHLGIEVKYVVVLLWKWILCQFQTLGSSSCLESGREQHWWMQWEGTAKRRMSVRGFLWFKLLGRLFFPKVFFFISRVFSAAKRAHCHSARHINALLALLELLKNHTVHSRNAFNRFVPLHSLKAGKQPFRLFLLNPF